MYEIDGLSIKQRVENGENLLEITKGLFEKAEIYHILKTYQDVEGKGEDSGPYIKTIELDCAPGGMRPEHLIRGVIGGTGLEVKEPSNKLFGNWTWDYSEIDDETWRLIKPLLRERILKLHEDGIIRYGSW